MSTIKYNIFIILIFCSHKILAAPNTVVIDDKTHDVSQKTDLEPTQFKAYECLIKNGKYIFDYLYASKEKDSFFINKKTKDNILNRFSNNRQVLIINKIKLVIYR